MIRVVCVFLLVIISSAFSQNVNPPDSTRSDTGKTWNKMDSLIQFSTLSDNSLKEHKEIKSPYPFKIGEKLVFEIKYSFIKAGWATMEVRDTLQMENSKVLLIQTTAKSTKGFDPFFKVRDTVQTYIDFYRFLPLKFIKKLREGGYLHDLFVDYDHDEHVAHVRTIRYKDDLSQIRKKDSLDIPIPEEVYDVLSSFYKVRTYDLDLDSVIYITNHDNKKIYDLKVVVLKREVVKTPAGKFRCLKIEPKLRGEAIFKQKGRLWVWITDDEYKIPVKMSSKVVVGSINTVLKEIINGPDVIPAKVN